MPDPRSCRIRRRGREVREVWNSRHGERRVTWGCALSPATTGAVHATARGLVFLAVVALAPAAHAEATAARALWVRGDRVYVAAADSTPIVAGMHVRFVERDRERARGEVMAVLDGSLGSVRITQGSLGPETALERLGVWIEAPSRERVATLRVGLPAAGRVSLAFPCERARLDPTALPRPYRLDTLATDAFRLVHADSSVTASPWPDTLLVRRYGERADQEIALERGELDVAVFWPGEPSARMRGGRWGGDALLGLRARGALVAIGRTGRPEQAAGLAADMAALDSEMFGGDLLPWSALDSLASAHDSLATPTGPGRYTVDASLPGHRTLALFLNRRVGAALRRDDRTVRVAYLDLSLAERELRAAEWQADGITPCFAIRCPVFSSPARGADIRQLGPDAFANLVGCGHTGRP